MWRFVVFRQGLEKMEREKQKTAEKKQPKESFEHNQRRGDVKFGKLSPKQFSKFVSWRSLPDVVLKSLTNHFAI